MFPFGNLCLVFSFIFLSLHFCSSRFVSRQSAALRPETFMTTPELIRFHGYKVEEHKVKTNDSYILTIFKIPATNTNSNSTGRLQNRPILLTHGIFCSSDDFLLQRNPNESLPFLLVDMGHNVWLGNYRGNSYAKEHADGISTQDPKFYDFGMDEMGLDVGAMIRYILKVEQASQLFYGCHSLGCNLISVAVNFDPGLNDLIWRSSFMSPGIYTSHLKSPLIRAAATIPHSTLQEFSQRFAGGRFLPEELSIAFKTLVPNLCGSRRFQPFCSFMLSIAFGPNPSQLVETTMSTILAHTPNETSMKLFIQYLQHIRSGRFEKFDYGPEKNVEIYGNSNPPQYNLSTVTFPVQGIYGLNDFLVAPADALRTFEELGNLVGSPIQVQNEKWTHIGFIYGKDAKTLVYDHILNFIKS